MRLYVTNNGYEMILPDTDERVMTAAELEAKYSGKKTGEKSKNTICPKCRTYCNGDCDGI